MATRDIVVTKTYRDGKTYFESQVDALKAAIETVSSVTNKNLNQLRKDAFASTYNYTNDGVAQLSQSLQAQIDNIAGGGTPVTGTTSNTFDIRSSSNRLRFDASGLSSSVTLTPPDGVSGAIVVDTATQTLTNKTLTSPVLTTPQINDTSADHQYIFAVSELAADRTVTLPLLAANDTFVFADFIQTLTNKTLTSPVLTTPKINNPALTFQYLFSGSAIAANRTVTLPLLAANDTFVFADFIQTLTNKTLTSPTINGAALSGTFSGSPTFSGTVTVQSEFNVGNGTTTVHCDLDRGSNATDDAQFRWATAGSVKWSLGLDNDSTENIYLKNSSSTSVWTIDDNTGQLLLPNSDPPIANYANRNGIVKGWLNYVDGSGSVTNSYNVSSLSSDDGDGDYLVFWDIDFDIDNNTVLACVQSATPTDRIATVNTGFSSVEINLYDVSGAAGTDSDFTVIAIGDQ